MLTEFEVRLVNVLGSRLAAPFGGRVVRRSATAPAGPGPVVRIGIDAVRPREPDFGSIRPELVPGSDDHRRVLRLELDVAIVTEPEIIGDSIGQLAAVDALVYELQSPDLRSAEALVQPGDQGFLIETLALDHSDLVVEPALRIVATGWFWPVGAAGQTGRPIEQARVREFRLPVLLDLGAPLIAGGPDIEFELALGATGTLNVADDATVAAPFGQVALQLVSESGASGAGSLGGGAAGPDESRVVSVTGGAVAATYTPPGTAVVDHLVVSSYTEDGDGERRIGVELTRFELAVLA